MNQKTVLPPLRHKPYGGAWSIHDPETKHFVENTRNEIGDRKQFLQDYKEWIGHDNNFIGLNKFEHLDFSAGTTETFSMFYFQHMNKRPRLLKGDFFYHWQMARNYMKQAVEIDAEPLIKGDVVVMSCPFSDTGDMPKQFENILERCEDLGIPVMLDMAYINMSNIKEINLDYKCIHTITTSLSKVFPVENHRIGIRFTRELYDDALTAYNQVDYVNLYSVNIGHKLIKRFDNAWLYEKYKDKQYKTCKQMQLTPSRCVIFGLDTEDRYPEYKRATNINRLCFSRVWDKRINAETN
jgi:hypothetical protein